MSRPLLIRGGRVVDPSQSVDDLRDVLVVDGVVAQIGNGIDPPEGAREIDARGLVVTPGLIDVHVHLREPGGEHRETIATGAKAAAAGGFTAVCAMPNTDPVVDDPAGVGFVIAQGAAAGAARVYPLGAISVGQEGKQLAAIGEMFEAGAVGITDDGNPVMDSGLMRRALDYAQAFGIPVADHPEDLGLSGAGVMNEGVVATRLGLHGKPNASEDVHIVRDLMLADLTGGRIHLQHVSTAYGVEAIRRAKTRGVRVTAEATPHHLLLTEERVEGFDTDAKMNPPLRASVDREAVREGLADGTLDVFASDHAPHHYDEKEQAFADAPNGIVGLETALGLGLTYLVGEGLIDLATLIQRMSVGPAEAFGLPGGTLVPGSAGDVTIINLDEAWTVDRDGFLSKSRNTPFHGWDLKGRACYTIVGGAVVWEADRS
ncbi:MAG: dihydroorotase [Gemmatimonadetes bacterium]|nr:dihydroorotase [Gemmatimonadota bacterium]